MAAGPTDAGGHLSHGIRGQDVKFLGAAQVQQAYMAADDANVRGERLPADRGLPQRRFEVQAALHRIHERRVHVQLQDEKKKKKKKKKNKKKKKRMGGVRVGRG